MASPAEQPLLVICGPTASGKSALAMKIARECNGEIICADSRTVYKGMDIGTAKPSQVDQRSVKHHLLDVVEPGERFTAHDFQAQAQAAIQAIRARDKLPILVGGTGLYLDSIIFNYSFPKTSTAFRQKLNAQSVEELREYCYKNNIILPKNEYNKRHLVTAIERHNTPPQRSRQPIDNSIIVGVTTNKADLEKRIVTRTEYIFSHGVVTEATKLGKMYGWDNEAMTANIYPIMHKLINNELTIEEAKQQSTILDRQLAKRQLTWLKRNEYINWLSLQEVETFLFNTLAKAKQK